MQIKNQFKNLKIGGVEPVSLLEREGSVSTIVFTLGCNFRCPFCHNPSLIQIKKDSLFYPIKNFLQELNKKKGLGGYRNFYRRRTDFAKRDLSFD